MAFLDNSGDIILDAVLTDVGRERLARGDGSFKIAKFALGDEEIDYGLYDKDDNRGSAYYDLEILQTPILEAFTNNTSTMKSTLLTITRNNLLYLPVIKLNQAISAMNNQANQAKGSFIVAADDDTVNGAKEVPAGIGTNIVGLMLGATPGDKGQKHIRLDQGLDTTEMSPKAKLDEDLVETQYLVEIDNRLGAIAAPVDGSIAAASFLDDDNIATYYFSLGTNSKFVTNNTVQKGVGEGQGSQTISGPRGTILQFRIASSTELQTSNYLFTKLGNTGQTFQSDYGTSITGMGTIDTQVRVSGLTTGYRVDIPVRFIKKTT
jgi:mannose/fructose/N-acetylgalactosamine-specific phosphotransferase system component IIB